MGTLPPLNLPLNQSDVHYDIQPNILHKQFSPTLFCMHSITNIFLYTSVKKYTWYTFWKECQTWNFDYFDSDNII